MPKIVKGFHLLFQLVSHQVVRLTCNYHLNIRVMYIQAAANKICISVRRVGYHWSYVMILIPVLTKQYSILTILICGCMYIYADNYHITADSVSIQQWIYLYLFKHLSLQTGECSFAAITFNKHKAKQD